MKHFLTIAIALLFLTSCKNELTFEDQSFHKENTKNCTKDCPHAEIKIPVAKNVPIVADSINNKVFNTLKEIIYVGEKPYTSKDYDGLLDSFMKSYDEMKKADPRDEFGWEATVDGKIVYHNENIIDIELKHYTFTGGAHGYSGKRSLIFDAETGKSISEDKLFINSNVFRVFAEKKFREAYKIPASAPINSTGLMFEDGLFHLPQTFFYTDKGFVLYYNVYEIASYADGAKELVIPFSEMEPYLAVK